MRAEVTHVSADGRPARARFTFTEEADSAAVRWAFWDRDRFVAFDVPPVGGSRRVSPARMPFAVLGGR